MRDIREWIEREVPQMNELTLIGSSLGGLTAARLAERDARVTKLVLLAPAFTPLAFWPSVLIGSVLPVLGFLGDVTMSAIKPTSA